MLKSPDKFMSFVNYYLIIQLVSNQSNMNVQKWVLDNLVKKQKSVNTNVATLKKKQQNNNNNRKTGT